MIFIGYQGVGKSTMAKTNVKFIDLESSNFWVNGKRADDWYQVYCNIAEDLSMQGYNVFVSSHEVVRKRLQNSHERVVAIFPAIELQHKWVLKLESRYRESGLTKDHKALMNTIDRFNDNIKEIEADTLEHIIITKINYSLPLEIERFLSK